MSAKDLPMWAQYAGYLGVRSLLSLPLVAGASPSLHAARVVARAMARSPMNRKRLARAHRHLEVAFPEWDEERRRRIASAGYEHMAMLAVEVLFAARLLTTEGWVRHVELGNLRRAMRVLTSDRPVILITGHNGNWEVLGYALALLGYPISAVYRPLDLAPLDAWVRRTRARRGIQLIDKFGAAEVVPRLLTQREPVGFVADQNGGDRGTFVPFFGRLASAYKSIGLLAVQHRALIVCGQARRMGWDNDPDMAAKIHAEHDGFLFRVEVEDMFGPDEYMHQPDPAFYLTARYRRAIENMIRRAPTDYLWMHRSWRSRPRHERLDKPFPDALKEKLASLPWLDDAGVNALIDRSDRDRATLRELGVDKLP